MIWSTERLMWGMCCSISWSRNFMEWWARCRRWRFVNCLLKGPYFRWMQQKAYWRWNQRISVVRFSWRRLYSRYLPRYWFSFLKISFPWWGDSGGSLLIDSNPRAKRHSWVLAGIVSYGEGCGLNPGIYTRISHFKNWVLSSNIIMTSFRRSRSLESVLKHQKGRKMGTWVKRHIIAII